MIALTTRTGTAVPSAPAQSARDGQLRATDRHRQTGETGPESLAELFARDGFTRHYAPGSVILLQQDRVEGLYLVQSGTVRCATLDRAGQRHIFAFLTSGMYLGIADLDRWQFTAEAVDHAILRAIPRRVLERECACNAPLRQDIRAHTNRLVQDLELQLLKMARASAHERLFGFLCGFAQRRKGSGYVVLPMSRRDIGDHIGLSVESVSRAFGLLKRKGLIDLKFHDRYRILRLPDET